MVFNSRGDAMDVVFEASTSEKPCEGFSKAAGDYDADLLSEKLLPFLAELQEKTRALMSIIQKLRPRFGLAFHCKCQVRLHGLIKLGM